MTRSAALPFRRNSHGNIEFLLITSSRRRRWIIPKGKVARESAPNLSAAREAFEEAGVIGIIGAEPIIRRGRPCAIATYPLLVAQQLEVWPEMQRRERRWVSLTEAVELLADDTIRDLIVEFATAPDTKLSG
jgi:8-oxo-dGTP pyrophosphatase MutT (NUDIX family)